MYHIRFIRKHGKKEGGNDDQHFLAEYRQLKEQEVATRKRFRLEDTDHDPCLNNKTAYTGFDCHYVYHTAWAARMVGQIHPKKHIDISSSLYFCSTVSAFLPVEIYDLRPAKLSLEGLTTGRADPMNLPFESDSVHSQSCMHTVEHIGPLRRPTGL